MQNDDAIALYINLSLKSWKILFSKQHIYAEDLYLRLSRTRLADKF